MSRHFGMLWILVTVTLTPAAYAAQARNPADLADATLRSHGAGLVGLRSDVIVSWNNLAHDIAFAEDQFLTFKGQRALAMMHLAMHDALNAIAPVYERYAHTGRIRAAHPIGAAAQAAHDVLLSQYPNQSTIVANELARWLAGIPSGALRESGIAVGHEAAAAVIAQRMHDGWDVQGTYEFEEGPGRYQTTPPWNGFVSQPGFALAKPFVSITRISSGRRLLLR